MSNQVDHTLPILHQLIHDLDASLTKLESNCIRGVGSAGKKLVVTSLGDFNVSDVEFNVAAMRRGVSSRAFRFSLDAFFFFANGFYKSTIVHAP